MTDDLRDFHEMDDGATEVVDRYPRHRGVKPLDVAEAAQAPAGGKFAAMTAESVKASRDYILLRTQMGSARISLPHAVVFRSLLALWLGKRTENETDPGVTIAEITNHLAERGESVPNSTISAALRNLANNGAARSIETHVGWNGRRVRYYPTDAGALAFAFADVLGDGALVQVGGTQTAWRSRDAGEPMNLFQHAASIRRGRPVETTSVESA